MGWPGGAGPSLAGPARPTGSVSWEGTMSSGLPPAQAREPWPLPPSPFPPALQFLSPCTPASPEGLTQVLEVY